MSDTPRTDKVIIEGCELGSAFGHFYVEADFARELERELEKAKRELIRATVRPSVWST